MLEIWSQIPGYEGYYEVSTLGRVRSMDREIDLGRSIQNRKGKPLKLTPDKDGYLRASLSIRGKNKKKRVNRLVLETFVGPSNLLACHHNDEPADNRLENLYWGTESSNQQDCVERGRNPNAKLTKDSINEIRELYATGLYTHRDLGPMFGVDCSEISRLLTGKIFKRL